MLRFLIMEIYILESNDLESSRIMGRVNVSYGLVNILLYIYHPLERVRPFSLL